MGNVRKYGKGGMNKTMKAYNMGGMANNMTSGDGNSFVSPESMNRNRIDYFANRGIEMVEDTMEFDMMKKGGSTRKGMVRKTARRAYKK
tara:strand:+ start:5798 stop:6064 length:267 start_codon:yes stop_codon:yes gene_type:complete